MRARIPENRLPAVSAYALSVTGVDAEVSRLAQRIIREVSPDRLILFGSRARGDARPDSDADFLVVMDVAPFGGSNRAAARYIRRALHDRALPMDVIVMTPSAFAQQRDALGTIAWPAVREGRLLYERRSPASDELASGTYNPRSHDCC